MFQNTLVKSRFSWFPLPRYAFSGTNSPRAKGILGLTFSTYLVSSVPPPSSIAWDTRFGANLHPKTFPRYFQRGPGLIFWSHNCLPQHYSRILSRAFNLDVQLFGKISRRLNRSFILAWAAPHNSLFRLQDLLQNSKIYLLQRRHICLSKPSCASTARTLN